MKDRTCSRCHAPKPEAEFYYNKTRKRPVSWCRDCFIAATRTSRLVLRARAMDILGSRCGDCGVTDHRVLCFDHRDGRRGKKRQSNDMIMKMIIGGSDEFQLLCHNCNHLKRLERHEFAPRDLKERVSEEVR